MIVSGGYMGGANVGGASGCAHQQVTSLLHQSFKNPNWPPNFITAENVLDYFCDPSNVFYDVSSCNQHLKMQNLNRPIHECLQSMQGIQFAVVGANHPLYVIVKQRRNSPTNVTPLCYYYVVNGTVYQCPDLYTFVQSRLIGAVDPLRRALEQARQFSRYNVAKGYYWEFKEPTGESDKEEKEEEKPLTARSTFFQRTRTEQLLRDLFERFPPPDDVKFELDSSEIASGEVNAGDRSGAPSRMGPEAGATANTPSERQQPQPQTGATAKQNVTGPASVPPPETQSNGAAHETSGPMSFPLNGHHQGTDVKRFKME
ncbi:unnamed protein product [Toxocara canis]|uniref:Mediator of RNA polymerase II transcription subunit 6 n=1 Tax=Toxocara canis TaxID=6265 RepID=A0A183V5P1_TOXCA|nr:unnamed protein product [Toxocara canis]